MKQAGLNPLMFTGMIGVLVIGSILAVQLYRAFCTDRNIWWTASTMPLKIDETSNSFEIFINAKSIHNHISDGTLLINQEGITPVSSDDITVRINNWHKIKSSILAYALLSSFIFGACMTMLVVGVIQSKEKHGTGTDSQRSLINTA